MRLDVATSQRVPYSSPWSGGDQPVVVVADGALVVVPDEPFDPPPPAPPLPDDPLLPEADDLYPQYEPTAMALVATAPAILPIWPELLEAKAAWTCPRDVPMAVRLDDRVESLVCLARALYLAAYELPCVSMCCSAPT